MKTSGFTLIELLAVIVILSLLALLASTSVTKLIKESKDDIYNIQLNSIKEAAETWGADNLLNLPSAGECKYLTVGELKEYGLLDENLTDSRNSTAISDDLKIKIMATQSKYGTNVTTYEVDPQSVNECTRAIVPLVEATTQTTKTTGNVPTGLFNAGDEYIINVDEKNSYHFFVLSVEDEKINLIMNRNICEDGTLATKDNKCFIKWSNTNANYGPVETFEALTSATNSWRNIPNISINYTDEENNYGSIITENNITSITKKDGTVTATYNGLKVRLPKKSELEAVGCTSNNGSCPKWVVDNLQNSSYYTDTTNIDGILGYWTLSSTENNLYAWSIYSSGKFVISYVYSVSKGIRPVISISKDQF